MSASYLSELESIRRETGGVLMPERVVAFAKNANTELHKHFTWDDGEAAHKYRLVQAGGLIRAVVKILPNPHANEMIRVRAYISLPMDRQTTGGYRLVDDVLKDPNAADIALESFVEDVERLQAKYSAFRRLVPMLAAISEVVATQKPKLSRPRAKRG